MNHMSYKRFLTALKEKLEEHLGEGRKVSLSEVVKPNLGKLDAFVIHQEERESSSASPIFYTKPYYEDYRKGKSMDEMVEEIAALYESHAPGVGKDKVQELMRGYGIVRDRVYFRLMNTQRNKELLKDVPHFDYLDFSMVFYVLAGEGTKGMASIRITNDMLQGWHVDLEELRQQAVENTESLFPAGSKALHTIVEEAFFKGGDEPPKDFWGTDESASILDDGDIAVLSNRKGINGFSVVLYKDYLQKLADRIQNNLYILPSSIHEALVFADTGDSGQAQILRKMVLSVNRSGVVEDEDFMSDEVYYYDRDLGRLEIAKEVGCYV